MRIFHSYIAMKGLRVLFCFQLHGRLSLSGRLLCWHCWRWEVMTWSGKEIILIVQIFSCVSYIYRSIRWSWFFLPFLLARFLSSPPSYPDILFKSASKHLLIDLTIHLARIAGVCNRMWILRPYSAKLLLPFFPLIQGWCKPRTIL
jgi:hypothetical protein